MFFIEKTKRRKAFGIVVVHNSIPFTAGLKNKLLEILGRFNSRSPFAGEPGNLFCPDREHIEDNVVLIKGKGRISGIEDFEQSL